MKIFLLLELSFAFVLVTIASVLPVESQNASHQEVMGAQVSSFPLADLPDSAPLLKDLDLRRWPDDAFFEAQVSRIDALSNAHGIEHDAVLLDLAELYLSQMLTQEAGEFVNAVTHSEWLGTTRFAAIRDAVHLLQGKSVEVVDGSPLMEGDRPDRGLWLALNGVANADAATLEANLESALRSLKFQSGPVARSLLPLILESAIALRKTALSEAGISLMQTLPELSQSPRGRYLLGKHNENLGNDKSALEDYFEAVHGWDRYAALSRVAIADMALTDGGSGALLAARDVLSAGSGAWRDHRLEVTVLERQALVNARLGDDLAALLAYRRMLTRFPDAPESERALRLVGKHLAAVSRKGNEGAIDLSAWIEVHQILLPAFRFLPQYAEFNEKLADKLFAMGGAIVAISEYRQTLTILEQREVMLGQPSPAEDVHRVRFKLALALERAGLWGEAIETLDGISEPIAEERRSQVNRLRIRALAELNENERLLRTFVANPDAETLRAWSQALFLEQNWASTVQQYKRLLHDFPNAFRVEDASYLLIAAYRLGDRDTARAVAQSFPELTTSGELAGLASSLLDDPSPLYPLREDAATTRLESAERAIELVEGSGL